MKTNHLPYLSTALLLALFQTANSQDNTITPDPTPATQPAVTPPAKLPASTIENLRMAGFPVGTLKFEPALEVIFELTPNQIQELHKAWEVTVLEAKKAVTGLTKNEAQKTLGLANRDFLQRRETILTEQQAVLIRAIQEAMQSTQVDIKTSPEAKINVDIIFRQKLKDRLNAEVLEKLKAAGGKLP